VALGSSAAPTARRTALVAVGLALAVAGCSAGQLAQTAYVQSAVDGASGQAGPIALRNISIAYPDSGRYQKGDSGRLEFIAVNIGDQADKLVDVKTDAAAGVTFGPATATGTATATATVGPPATESESTTPTATGSPTPAPPPDSPTTTGTPAATTAPATGQPASPTATGSDSTTPTATGTGAATATATGSAAPAAPAPVPLPPEGLTSFWAGGVVVTLTGLTRSLLPAEIVPITFVFEQAGEVTINVPVAVPQTPLPPPPTIDVIGETTPPG
jgi:copper(I)-binding protein